MAVIFRPVTDISGQVKKVLELLFCESILVPLFALISAFNKK